jgi:acetyltransferase
MINKELINPQSISIIGASNDTTKIGGKVLSNIIKANYQGRIQLLNPKETNVQGFKCINKPQDLETTELAILAVAVKYIKDYVKILAEEKKVRAFIILSAGFSEMGEEGRILEEEVTEIINKNNASLVGPNCIGVLTPFYAGIFAGPVPKLDSKGCDFVSGSGATAAFIIEAGIKMGLSFSSLYSVGNSAQIGVEEVVKYWDENYDPETSSNIKLIYMENVDKPKLLLKHCHSLIKKGCKIAAVKSGSSEAGSLAAASHTGALATSDTAVNSLFEKAGIIRCDGREDLMLTAALFSNKTPKGKNVAIVTHAGGPGVMLTDALSNGGLSIPHLEGEEADKLLEKLYPGSSVSNPIDFLATGNAEQLGLILDSLDNDFDNIDSIAVIFGSPGLFDVSEVYKVLNEKMESCKKPIYPILPSIVTAHKEIEYFKSFGKSFFSDEVLFGKTLSKVLNTPKQVAIKSEKQAVNKELIRKTIESSKDGYLGPDKMQSLLDAVNIPRVHEFVAKNIDDAISAVQKTGYPIVMKVIGPLHKSDVGGVSLNIKDEDKVRSEFDRLMSIKEATGVLIQSMATGMELFVGAKYEPKFGHTVLCGLGGIFIEVLKDTSSALAPISFNEAERMIKSLNSYKMIEGVRGQAGINQKIFAEIITKLSALLDIAPEIQELDLNPLLATEKQVIAVDARIRIEK